MFDLSYRAPAAPAAAPTREAAPRPATALDRLLGRHPSGELEELRERADVYAAALRAIRIFADEEDMRETAAAALIAGGPRPTSGRAHG